ncbi:Activator of 90 kDa heat shock protein ATPase-like protein 2 [Microtus ochrogaster]|uniref:Activator of 90 kDa heat shock protein ATPase-like protein 2 n=1 Tax=Microtus ochrogaster TaxID=79684 RepID=A0A8J6L3I3_MICOH|nr:Activator of 90 kDa heat shock protein ATPase-like protein 2 [Microtus ochrogaster]
MAKWGQGDPRWIVEEREDGTNVNNWHWCGRRAGGRLGFGRGRAPGRAARPCSTLAPGERRFVTALAFRLQDPPESWAKPHEGLLPHPPTSVPRSPHSRPSSGLSCVVRVRVTERDATVWSKGKLRELLVGIAMENEAGRCEISELKQVEGEASCSSRKGKLIFFYETERDATVWSKGKLRELLVGIAMENEAGRCEISELKQVEGEASCSSRKGKLIFFYEWNIKLSWKGTVKESGAKHKGLIEIPNLSEENDVDDTEVQASPVALGVRIPTVALHLTELFDTTVEQLYSIFTVKDLVQKFSKSPAVLEAEKGGKFQMFDGNITGEYVELLTNRKIIMKWRCRNWPEEHYATVALNFVPAPGQTELQLDCKGVPVCKEENTKFCWQKQHFEEIKGLLQLTTQNA